MQVHKWVNGGVCERLISLIVWVREWVIKPIWVVWQYLDVPDKVGARFKERSHVCHHREPDVGAARLGDWVTLVTGCHGELWGQQGNWLQYVMRCSWDGFFFGLVWKSMAFIDLWTQWVFLEAILSGRPFWLQIYLFLPVYIYSPFDLLTICFIKLFRFCFTRFHNRQFHFFSR